MITALNGQAVSSPDEIPSVILALKPGTKGKLAYRASVQNATAWTVGQKADIITIECGEQRKDPPAENGVQTVTQTLMVTAVTETDALLVA